MAIYYARKTGNVNATDVWATTPTGAAGNFFSSFTNQDILMANNFTITLNVNTTVLEVRNDASNSATAGGGFTLSDSVTLSADIYGNLAVTYSGNTSATINGSVQTTVTNGITVYMAGAGTLYINGVLGPSRHTNAECVRHASAGSLIFTGTVYAGVSGGQQCCSILVYTNSGTTTVNGTCVTTGAGGFAIVCLFTGSVIINGSIVGGTILINSACAVTVNGIAAGGVNGPGISMTSIGSCIVTRAKGNNFGPGSVGTNSQVGIAANQTGSAKVYEIEYGPLGQSPTSGPVELIGANSNVAVFATRFGNPKTLVDLNNSVNLVPTSGNVRSGVAYNYGNNSGVCVVPNPNSVVYGVPVDNTVGSGLLSPVAVWNALTSAIGTSGSIAERLKNCSTVATVGKQLEGVL